MSQSWRRCSNVFLPDGDFRSRSAVRFPLFLEIRFGRGAGGRREGGEGGRGQLPIDLEEGNVTEIGGCYFEDLSSVFSESAANGGTGDDSTEFEDFDALENLRGVGCY